VLAASRITDRNLDRQQVFQDFIAANLRSIGGIGGVNGVEAEIYFDLGANYIESRGTMSADVNLLFPFLHGDKRRLSAVATAFESTKKLEVVMALDNTGSMGEARMKELRKAATSLVDILETAATDRHIRAGLVPFTTSVNVRGEGFKMDWIDRLGQARYHGANFDEITEEVASGSGRGNGNGANNPPPGCGQASDTGKQNSNGNGWGVRDDCEAGTQTVTRRVNHFELFDALNIEWKGCVEARPTPYNLSLDVPSLSNPDTLFVPYFAPDEPGNARKSNDNGTQFNNTYLNDMVEGTERERQRSIVKYNTSTPRFIAEGASLTNGPNYACPTPIVPLTDDFRKLRAEIAKMIHWYGSGTNVSEGVAWAQRVLSPTEPYADASPFRADDVSKFAVIFTDGENNVFGASSQAINKSDYGSYSFVDQGRMGPDRGRALTQVNDWTLAACEDLKSRGVEVFTVLLGADTAANRTLYTKCASSAQNYFPTSNVSQLTEVFSKIAARITRLYLSS
jgi:hypothetical protein